MGEMAKGTVFENNYVMKLTSKPIEKSSRLMRLLYE